MLFDVIDKKIRKAFSDAAMHYDMLTGLHKEIGRELTKKIGDHGPCTAVLDIGMGTGWFTHRLTDIFPCAVVVGLDFASGMIASARKREGTYKIVQADAAYLPFKEGVFDIITSNLAYQWIEHLPRAFGLCHSRLNKNGILCFTMFGHHTFDELFTALEMCTQANGQGKDFAMRRLADKDQVAGALGEAGFKDAYLTAERIRVRFPDMMGLVKWVKDIGANSLPRDMYMGKDLLVRANDYYNTHFRDRLGVYATFEVIWVEARRCEEGER
jgi:malonyl-CoA O-methyltransferase